MPRQSRRAMLGNAAYVLAASASAIGITAGAAASVADFFPNAPDDARLLVVCAKAEEADRLIMKAFCQHQLHGANATGDAARHECDNRFDEFVGLADEAALIPAQTMAGLRAKARVVYLNMNTTLRKGDISAVILRDIGWGAGLQDSGRPGVTLLGSAHA